MVQQRNIFQKQTQQSYAELQKVDMSVITQAVEEAEVVTASALDKRLKEKLSEVLKSKMKKEISIKNIEDPKIISGAVLGFGSLRLDGSLQNFIRQTAVHLKEKIEKGAWAGGKGLNG